MHHHVIRAILDLARRLCKAGELQISRVLQWDVATCARYASILLKCFFIFGILATTTVCLDSFAHEGLPWDAWHKPGISRLGHLFCALTVLIGAWLQGIMFCRIFSWLYSRYIRRWWLRLPAATVQGTDIVLHDSAGNGRYDIVEGSDFCTDSGRKYILVDAIGDGCANIVLLSTVGNGQFDSVFYREEASLTFMEAEILGDVRRLIRQADGQFVRAREATPEAMKTSPKQGAYANEHQKQLELYPAYWQKFSSPFAGLSPEHNLAALQNVLSGTFVHISTKDRAEEAPLALRIVRVFRNENAVLWKRYSDYRQSLKEKCAMAHPVELSIGHGMLEPGSHACTTSCDPLPRTSDFLPAWMSNELDASIGEQFLYHGTSPLSAAKIKDHGFDISLAGSGAGTLYGNGIYFSECSSKSDEYAKKDEKGDFADHFVMLLCRVALGRVLEWELHPGKRLQQLVETGKFDSILGNREKLRGTYREFVLPPKSCNGTYPEWIIVYRRIP